MAITLSEARRPRFSIPAGLVTSCATRSGICAVARTVATGRSHRSGGPPDGTPAGDALHRVRRRHRPLTALRADQRQDSRGRLAVAPLDGRPPTFRAWDVTDLAAHLGEVHRWAAETVVTGHRLPIAATDPSSVSPRRLVRRRSGRLLEVLATTDPERTCWTHHPRGSHRALLAPPSAARDAGPPVGPAVGARPGDLLADVDPAVCADGVDEVLTVFPRRSSPADRVTLSATVGLHATDAGRSWTLVLVGS